MCCNISVILLTFVRATLCIPYLLRSGLPPAPCRDPYPDPWVRNCGWIKLPFNWKKSLSRTIHGIFDLCGLNFKMRFSPDFSGVQQNAAFWNSNKTTFTSVCSCVPSEANYSYKPAVPKLRLGGRTWPASTFNPASCTSTRDAYFFPLWKIFGILLTDHHKTWIDFEV